MPVLKVSARTGVGMEEFLRLLTSHREELRTAVAAAR